MTEQEIKSLLEKYQMSLCTKEEEQLAEDFLQSFQKDESDSLMDRSEIERRIFSKISTEISEKEKEVKRSSFLRLSPLKFAAVILLLITSTWLISDFYDNKPSKAVFVTKSTLRGQKSNIVLNDGTTIRLNSESTLIFPEEFSDGKREVTLIGEAFFEVTRNPTMPFIIHTGDLETTVLGTSFNVKAFEHEDAQITVATGKVKVAPTSTENPSLISEIILTPNQQATYNSISHDLTKKEVNIERYLAWKKGGIIFDKITFEETALILERWFNIEIVFENDIIKNCIIRSEYNNENLINILESLKFIQGIDYRFVENNRIVITGNTCNSKYEKDE